MKIQKAIEILSKYNHPTTIVNRELKDQTNFRKIIQQLGNPHQNLKIIHISGTNGKGSVALKTATILEKAGKKVGLYTSPHIHTFRERIQINRE